MKELFVWFNDALVPTRRASLQVGDLSIQRGYAIFDFFKTLDGRPIFLNEHLDRFFRSAERMRLETGLSADVLRGRIDELMEKNQLPDSGVRLTLTGGYAADAYSIDRPNLVISQSPLTVVPTAELPVAIRLVSYPHIRQLPDVKTIDYLMAIWLKPFIREQGADDVLYHLDGVVSECPRSNVFILTGEDGDGHGGGLSGGLRGGHGGGLSGGRLVTPSRNILHGVIRGKVMELARRQVPVEERDMTLEELYAAKEVFITSTGKHIWPVVNVDGRTIGKGKPGPLTEALNRDLYRCVKGA
ncbi:MAG TPA: aminotransferase class IV [Puia sp.]|nr:aminotransferase class IV [Puia sp.]